MQLGPAVSSLALVMLAMEIAPLVRDLREWEPVGVLAEQLLGAVSDTDGLTQQDINRARNWHRRWQAMHPELRAWYATVAPQGGPPSTALWHILQGNPHHASGKLKGATHQAYREQYGHSPPWSLFPRLP